MENLYVKLSEEIGLIEPEVYGHFSEQIGGVFYGGLWVGEDSDIPNVSGFRLDAVEKLRALRVPVLRWPGGCFAETYNWRDGIGPKESRPVRPSWWTYDDGRLERNEVGTHEFVKLCRLIGAKPYIGINITSMTPMDARDWMDYCNSPRGSTSLALEREKNGAPEPFGIPFWGVGNETWGGGGEMTPENYAHEYRRYAAVLYDLTRYLGGELFISGSNGTGTDWTKRCLGELKSLRYSQSSGYTVHYYCGYKSFECRGFDQNHWYEQLRLASRIQEVIENNWAVVSEYGMEDSARLVIDEWGTWYKDGSGPSKGRNLFEQQSTMRDALVAGLTLNTFNNNCEKIRMANLAQVVNCLQSVLLIGEEGCVATPTYHVFDLYQGHMGGKAVRTVLSGGSIPYTSPKDGSEKTLTRLTFSASVKAGTLTVTVTNADLERPENLSLCTVGGSIAGPVHVRTLAAANPDTVNTFEHPDAVCPGEIQTASPDTIMIPPASVVLIEAQIA